MPEPSIELLRADLDRLQAETIKLREKLEKSEVWLKALAIVAVAFGIAAGAGWKILSSAQAQLVKLETDAKNANAGLVVSKSELFQFTAARSAELAASATSAVASAAGNVGTRLGQIDSRLAVLGSEPELIESNSLGGLVRGALTAACPPGKAVKSIKVHAGGTCNSNCDNDGRPIVKFELTCVRL